MSRREKGCCVVRYLYLISVQLFFCFACSVGWCVPLAFLCSILIGETVMFAVRFVEVGDRGLSWCGIVISFGRVFPLPAGTHGNWKRLKEYLNILA